MAAVILSNHLSVGGGKVVILYKPGGTATVDKTLANLATGGETVTAADITRIWYTGAGTMHIRRNSTIVFVTDSEASLEWNLKESGIALSANNDKSINVIFSDANSTAIIELQKTSNHGAANA
tara:strand:+ start:39 stop:407 length:369 start_codon:yes stop_codon:yes gene_type:complete